MIYCLATGMVIKTKKSLKTPTDARMQDANTTKDTN